MGVQVYSATTSVPQGGSLDLHLNADSGAGTDATVMVTEFVSGNEMARFTVHVDAHPTPGDPAADRGWPVGFTLDVPQSWPSGLHLLRAYQVLVCVGHDEYWTAEMRDTAEQFLAAGGNIAFLTGNTCWWQFRLEDDGRTFVCHRDAAEDPLTGIDNARVTVEWSSAPVNRPGRHPDDLRRPRRS
ncbi:MULTISPECIES: N,N-dimethylformamidase beta subunit family domain-containing protein [unclassified Frankia]|uniref:N,N-dimethylformamidase beta subunit family domain-containing protein n=1 Tax=unclassified Frankia TaxID=2632575 RepID=UPI002AD232C7|nr:MULTISPECIES: N,N-dimethylformamidase beta subunit family domain-containing protein [unclassified Frankia]